MKLSIFFLVVLIFLTAGIKAQSTYPESNLVKASPEQLKVLLENAQKTKTAGAAFSIAGPLIAGAGLFFFAATQEDNSCQESATSLDISWVTQAGTLITIFGVPMLIIGSTRVNRIKRIMNSNDKMSFKIAPCRFGDQACRVNRFGVELSINF